MTDPPAPSTIVETVPAWLGRTPVTGETVLVGLTPMDAEHLVILALQPDREPLDEVQAMRQLVVDGAEQVAIVAYIGSEEPVPSIPEAARRSDRLEATLRFLAAAAGRYGHDVIGVLVVVPSQRDRAGYFRSLPDPTRNPLPTPTEENP